jgi:hypothetical protein
MYEMLKDKCPALCEVIKFENGVFVFYEIPDVIIGMVKNEFMKRGCYFECVFDPFNGVSEDRTYMFSYRIHRNGRWIKSKKGELVCCLGALLTMLKDEVRIDV